MNLADGFVRAWRHLRTTVADGWVRMQGDDDTSASDRAAPNERSADRRRLDDDLPAAIASGRRTAVVRVDVDHLETYRQAHGADAVDQLLELVSAILGSHVRDGDVVYGYDDDDFCVLVPDTTDQEARTIAERLRAAVEAERFPGEDALPGGRITISLGLALTHGGDANDVLRSADGALDEAKQAGRNRVVVVLGPEGPGLLLS